MGKSFYFIPTFFLSYSINYARIGRCFHTHPYIGHSRSSFTEAGYMEPGTIFTIEPIVCAGTNEYIQWGDQWTYTSKDGKPSAQFEHTILITNNGTEILTQKLPDSPKYFWET
jgi:methionyl aminopeptidase